MSPSVLFACVFALLANDAMLSQEALTTAAKLRDEALKGNGAYEIVESLTTEVGPRRAGTPADRAAVAWGVAKLNELGFDKVWTDPVTFPFWIRGEESCEVVSPFPQPLHITALGNSVGTPDEGIQAEVVLVPDFEALASMDQTKVDGKIVFINNRMERTRTGQGYGVAVIARRSGASASAKLGAVAVLIRSIGTDSHRFPHTGVMRYQDAIAKIPAAALSNPDANLLERMIGRGKPVTVKLTLSSRSGGTKVTHNVIGEIKGSSRPDEVVLLGAHLDSWDLGTGALDDGAGVGIVTEAARLIGTLPRRPARTIRVVLFGNEEEGLYGARAYAEKYGDAVGKHIIGAESDFGADKIWSFMPNVDENALPIMRQIHSVLEPLGVEMGPNTGWGGPDMGPMRQLGMPVATLFQDGTDYFDYHHTADDTLDKIDPANMRQNVAAYVAFAYLCAESPVMFRDLERAMD